MNGKHIDEIELSMKINKKVVAEGKATAVLGSPLSSLREQQLSLSKAGMQLMKGQVVLTGAVTAAMMLSPGDIVQIETNGIGSVELICTE